MKAWSGRGAPAFDKSLLETTRATLLSREGEHSFYRLDGAIPGGALWTETAPWTAEESCRELQRAHRLNGVLDPVWSSTPFALLATQDVLVAAYRDPVRSQAPIVATGVGAFLDLAVGAATALAHAHRRKVIHRDLRPTKLIAHTDGAVRLAGFGRAMTLDEPGADWSDLPVGDDALAYAAPEAARRSMPYADERSDLYSLGVTFFEWLTGHPPFRCDSVAEWLHVHVAVEPPRLSAGEAVPPLLENLILKLMAKDPEQRYGGAASVRDDLVRCRAEWIQRQAITPFALDRPERRLLALPDRLFGREAEIDILLQAGERVRRTGASELALIAGPPGAGKSALVRAFQGDARWPCANFASGKSDQHQRDIPFLPFTQVLRLLVENLLAKGRDGLEHGRERLLNSLAGHGQLVIDLVPELELVIGRSPDIVELPAEQAKLRLNATLIRALEAFGSAGDPLVLFLDDLQWADPSTKALVASMSAQATRNLLVLVAYRNAEAEASAAPVTLTQAHGSMRTTSMTLVPLSRAEVTALIAAAMRAEPRAVDALASAVHERTAGNPFFINHFLRNLVDEGVLRIDKSLGAWTWDLDEVRRHRTAENVVELMGQRLEQQSAQGREILGTLALIGSGCSEILLSKVLGKSAAWIRQHALPLKDAGLIVRSSTTYAFAHDRVLDAAHAMSSEGERARVHSLIAKAMIDLHRGHAESAAFATASQIEKASDNDLTGADVDAFSLALLTAARRAKGAAAIDQASGYLRRARLLLGPDAWRDRYALTFQIALMECECLVLGSQWGPAATAIDELLERSRSAMDRAAGFRVKAVLENLRSDYDAAISAMLQGLGELGIELARFPTPERMAEAYCSVRAALNGRRIADIVDLPASRDPRTAAAMELLVTCQASFFVNDGISFLHLAKIVELTLASGPTPASVYGLAWFGVYVAHHQGAYDEGFSYAQAAAALIERHGWTHARAAMLVAMDQVSAWTQPLDFALASAREAALAGALAGDPSMTCYAGNHIVSDMLFMGERLPSVVEEADRRLAATRQIGFRDIERLIEGQRRFATRLSVGVGSGADAHEDDFDASDTAAVSQPTLFWELLYAAMAAVFLKDVDRAAWNLDAASALTWSIPAHINIVDYHLYAAITRADAQAGGDATIAVERLLPHRARLAAWAELNPPSFRNKLLLVDAEIARRRGNAFGALRLYEDAAAAAAAAGFVHEEGLAHERAAALCEAGGLRTSARQHLRTARDCYRRWGANAKVAQLEAEQDFLAGDERPNGGSLRSDQASLDVAVWSEAARTFSEEIELDRLVEKLLRSMIIHAGASSGVLLLIRDGATVLEAAGRVVDGAVSVEIGSGGPAAKPVPPAVLGAVMRTLQPIVVDDQDFRASAGAAATGSYRSMMCLPLVKQGRLVGVLHLENDLAGGVFTTARAAMLELLAPQAAVSLEAAWLYDELLQENARRRRSETALRGARAELARVAQITVMGGLAASIAHEINQPLTGVASNAAAAVRWLRRDTPELVEALSNLDAIRQNVVRATDIVRALRSLAKQAPVVLGEILVDDVIREVLALTSAEIEARRVSLATDLAVGAVVVHADRVQLQQVILNLVTNAVEAMEGVEIQRRTLAVRSSVRGGEVVVTLQDSGAGIEAPILEKIFEAFYTTKSSGMGMGLTICRSIMSAHGGRLEARSDASGTTFTFSLPVAQAAS